MMFAHMYDQLEYYRMFGWEVGRIGLFSAQLWLELKRAQGKERMGQIGAAPHRRIARIQN